MAELQNDTPQEQAKPESGKGFLIGLVIAAVIAAGAGAGLAFMLAPKFVEAEKAVAAARAQKKQQEADKAMAENTGHESPAPAVQENGEPVAALADLYRGDVTLVRLKPITTNLRKPFRAWVRLEGALILAEEKSEGEEEASAENAQNGEGGGGKEHAPSGEAGKTGEGEGSGIAAVEKGGIPALAALIQEDVHAYLRTLSLKDLEGAGNLAYLRDDLTERAAIRSGGRVKEFVILSLVVEE